MFDKINTLFHFTQKILNIYEKRQEILASNIANADTINYQAMDINFSNELKKQMDIKNIPNKKIFLTTTSPLHFNTNLEISKSLKIQPIPIKNANFMKKNKNTVDMNAERIKFLDNSIKYQVGLIFLNHQIKNIVNVIRG